MSIGDTLAKLETNEERRDELQARIDGHEAETPTPVTGRRQGANYDRAKAMFPSVNAGEKEWVALFDRDPGIMWAILGDIAKAYTATEGPRKTGRRPNVSMSLRQLEEIITPRYSMEPFAKAVTELIGNRSLRAFAAKIPMHHHTLTRLRRGDLPLTRQILEQIARAGKVSPAYFVEWRAMFVAEAVTEVFTAKPNLSIRAVKALSTR